MSCVIVLGCFRSGTSAVAGVLHHLGIPMGEVFDEPNKNNIHGFWEDVEFKSLHSQLDCGEKYENILSFYENLIKKRCRDHEIWGLKDPLLCKYFDFFVKNLPCEHRTIICRRSIDSIASSMERALCVKHESFYSLAKLYTDFMEEKIANYSGPTLTIHHEELIANPEIYVKKIADFSQVPVTEAAVSHIIKV